VFLYKDVHAGMVEISVLFVTVVWLGL